MTHNRSSEELAMRGVLEAWGRARWPDARIFHELTIEQCRIDLAFILPKDLIGIEIKSSKDTLDRLPKQLEVFKAHLPKVYVAHAPKWSGQISHGQRLEVLLEDDATLKAGVYERGWHAERPNWRCYSRMLDILWAAEARAICGRHLMLGDKRQTLGVSLPRLALKLTGEQIVEEVCRELRGRDTAYTADAPIRQASHPARHAPDLFGASDVREIVAEMEGR